MQIFDLHLTKRQLKVSLPKDRIFNRVISDIL